ncbi:MAG: hypothetical protein F6J98_07650 [Moorea sp. SIO4G2]|uniref:hypothetical protein n=1 Tax=unclassified Moorena TaxID=2683338 RepID=UPI0013F79967|nr:MULTISPECIES: hypothetical protein [unclassified Moorena]NEO14792.1 hypothetical protein [Moorena sp. SIO3E8]NEO60306.1 hypothetical protein [Moorena sp. SIO4G2]NEQ01190.1 hypothetical protein [Moorena sp. SIO3F7]
MSQVLKESSNLLTADLKKLKIFLQKNSEVDFRKADLLHTPNLKKYKWIKFKDEDEKTRVLNLLKAYQRMLRIVPKGREDVAMILLEGGFQSSVQIVNTPKKAFLKFFQSDRELGKNVLKRAIAVHKIVTLQYIARVEQAQPHARAVSRL